MYCLSVWNGFKDHRAPKKTALMRCFPKASAKVVLFFIPANYYDNFFTKILNFFKHLLIFSDLQKRLFRAFFSPQKQKDGKNQKTANATSLKNTLFVYSFFKKKRVAPFFQAKKGATCQAFHTFCHRNVCCPSNGTRHV